MTDWGLQREKVNLGSCDFCSCQNPEASIYVCFCCLYGLLFLDATSQKHLLLLLLLLLLLFLFLFLFSNVEPPNGACLQENSVFPIIVCVKSQIFMYPKSVAPLGDLETFVFSETTLNPLVCLT